MENYTLEDIRNFILVYTASFTVDMIPVLKKKDYRTYYFEKEKRDFFQREFNKKVNSSPEEQQEYIRNMTPVLDHYYNVELAKKARNIK